MPNANGSAKKQNAKSNQKQSNSTSGSANNSGCSEKSNSSGSAGPSTRARKRKYCEIVKFSDSDLESELEDCNLEDAIAIEKKLRTVKEKNSLSDEEMRKLLGKFVKNDHILALVTLQAENELAKEKKEAELKRSLIITHTPNVPKLTRAKAKELNKSPTIVVPPIPKDPYVNSEIASLINEVLHSDEEDEEYTFKEDDFHSDEDPNTTVSDLDSNPRTPQTPLTATEYEDSPVKYTEDGCFKIPLEKKGKGEDLKIYARTRSKLSLQTTAIEDIEANFVPPDVERIELQDLDYTATDDDWMQFLNDFTKPLSNSIVNDEDDPVNDPEYVAAEKERIDAEELRNVNISKKELTELVAELFEGLLQDNGAIDAIELETPQKFLSNNTQNNSLAIDESTLNTPINSAEKTPKNAQKNTTPQTITPVNVARQINFDSALTTPPLMPLAPTVVTPTSSSAIPPSSSSQNDYHITDLSSATSMPSNNYASYNNDYSFQPGVMSTPSVVYSRDLLTSIPVANTSFAPTNSPCKVITIPQTSMLAEPNLIAVPVPGQPNCYQIAKVLAKNDAPPQHFVNNDGTRQGALPQVTTEPAEIVTTDSTLTETVIPKGTNTTRKTYAKAQFPNDTRYTLPYDANHTWEYISIKRHLISEHKEEFENLRYLAPNLPPQDPLIHCTTKGLTPLQHDLLQQQFRIHVQFLTQSFLQTYSHPDFWKLAPKVKDMLIQLKERSKTNATFRIWNLEGAIELVERWEADMAVDSEENREMMRFIHQEIETTNRNARQIPRFASKILDFMLDSSVFMYPQYLPRIPFTPKVGFYDAFAPSEAYLIAIGLDKHLKFCKENKPRKQGKYDPFELALRRLSKDTIHGKRKRRVSRQIQMLRSSEGYNPIKYYFDHDCAPPTIHKLIGFENNSVPKLRDRFPELPPGWQKYISEKIKKRNSQKITSRRKSTIDRSARNNNSTATAVPRVSEKAKLSYLEFVREAVGEEISLPDNFVEAAQPHEGATAEPGIQQTTPTSTRFEPSRNQRLKNNALPASLTINVNYVFGASIPFAGGGNTTVLSSTPNTSNINSSVVNSSRSSLASSALIPNNSWLQIPSGSSPLPQTSLIASNLNNCLLQLPSSTPRISSTTISSAASKNNRCLDLCETNLQDDSLVPVGVNDSINTTPSINYTFDLTTQSLRPLTEANNSTKENSTQKKLTDYYSIEEKSPSKNWIDLDSSVEEGANSSAKTKNSVKNKLKKFYGNRTCLQVTKAKRKIGRKYRQQRQLKKRCSELLCFYQAYLDSLRERYKNVPLIQQVYIRFKSLELYSKLLVQLKMICRNAATASSPNSGNNSVKRSRLEQSNENEANNATRSKRAHRQEESLRQMLMPETADEANRKDAIFAFNFYEKVEEILSTSKRPEDCKKFNTLLKNFDPSKDKVSDLYYKMEKLFLPDHPELAQVFLTFLLPSEAAEIGKFFEHFMITNATTFINKLNIYFNKQPAQIRKIYNCLNELAEDPKTDLKQVEAKILPLLKGNQFLIDWFMQQFPEAPPPERILPNPESINLKEVYNTQNGEYMEHVVDLMESPTQEHQFCQLRYINGRIFYGSKIVLPAKLSFMATKLKDAPLEDMDIEEPPIVTTGCIHGIREQGEKRLNDATAVENANAVVNECASDDNDKSEEEDTSKALVIDTTTAEEDSCSSIETCDEATLKAHAMRLNPGYYSSSIFSSTITSTPNPANVAQQHHSHARKSSLNFNDENSGKISPRKHGADIRSLGLASISGNALGCNSPTAEALNRDKRKSPTKKIKSPVVPNNLRNRLGHLQPMVVIHEQSPTLACARKLKSLINEGESNEIEEEDQKSRIAIVARTKSSLTARETTSQEQPSSSLNSANEPISDFSPNPVETKIENTDDLEFLPETAEINLSTAPFPSIKMDIDSSADEAEKSQDSNSTFAKPQASKSSGINNDRIVTQFDSDEDCKLDVVATLVSDGSPSPKTSTVQQQPAPVTVTQAWTRDEDKVILIEMKLGSRNREDLFDRIQSKLTNRTLSEINSRHQFLMDFLSKLQGK